MVVQLVIFILNLTLLWEAPCDLANASLQIDEFQNVYVFNDHELLKYNKKGENHFEFSGLRNGDITSVDVSNPLRVSVYFGGNNEVIFLDNTLTIQGESINFNELGFYDVTLVSSSFENHLWLYRVAEQKMIRVDRHGSVVNESGNIGMWVEREERFVQLVESGNFLYLVSDIGTVLIFDQYGAFISKITFPNAERFHFQNKSIYYLKNERIFLYQKDLLIEETLINLDKLEFSEMNQIDFNSSHIAGLKGQMLSLSGISEKGN